MVSDKRTIVCVGGNFQEYAAEVITAQDYYPFGMIMPNRSYTAPGQGYRYGFNGQEADDEVAGDGNSVVFKYRILDPRIGRFLSVDPLGRNYPWNSSYCFAENSVIDGIDLEGMEYFYTADGQLIGKFGSSTEIRVIDEERITHEKVFSLIQATNGLEGQGSGWVLSQVGQFLNQRSMSIIDAEEEIQREIYCFPVSDNIQRLLNDIIESEGGYVDNPNDAGGKTNYGIAENREWTKAASLLGIAPGVENIKKISSTQAQFYYFTTRLEAYKIPDMNNFFLQKAVLNQSVLTPGIINKNLKRTLNDLGYNFEVNSRPLTDEQIDALNSVDGNEATNTFLDYQQEYYDSLDNDTFIDGWTNRVNELRPPEEADDEG